MRINLRGHYIHLRICYKMAFSCSYFSVVDGIANELVETSRSSGDDSQKESQASPIPVLEMVCVDVIKKA